MYITSVESMFTWFRMKERREEVALPGVWQGVLTINYLKCSTTPRSNVFVSQLDALDGDHASTRQLTGRNPRRNLISYPTTILSVYLMYTHSGSVELYAGIRSENLHSKY